MFFLLFFFWFSRKRVINKERQYLNIFTILQVIVRIILDEDAFALLMSKVVTWMKTEAMLKVLYTKTQHVGRKIVFELSFLSVICTVMRFL